MLVLISGPIAAGKTTVAYSLAALARSRGLPSAAIDMDEMIATVAGDDWSLVQRGDRLRACRIAASLAQALFDAGMEVVAIAGSTLSPYEWDEVTGGLDTPARTTTILLRVSVDEAVRRAQADPARVHTQDAAYVAKLAAAIDWTAVSRPDIDLNTDHLTAQEVIGLVAECLAGGHGLPVSSQGEGTGGQDK